MKSTLGMFLAIAVVLTQASAQARTFDCTAGTAEVGKNPPEAVVARATIETSRPSQVKLPVDSKGTEFVCSSMLGTPPRLTGELHCWFDDLDSNPRVALVLPSMSVSDSTNALRLIVPEGKNPAYGFWLTCQARR